MKPKRIISLLLAAVLAVALLPTMALAVTTVNKITITMTEPSVGKALPTDAATSSTGSTHVTNVSWTGATDNGLKRGDTAYTATFTIEIKPDKDAKAYVAGITAGVGNNAFDPNGTLTRQQMATFLYRALQYVKDNSDTEYSIYDSQLANYSDASQLASWAVDPMAFMNAFGLIKGTSDTTLSPNNPCTIEQAVIVALRSLDAGLLGWYQYDGDIGSIGHMTSFTRYTNYVSWEKLTSISNGERVFVTAITRHKNQVSQGVYETSYYGNFTDRYGRSAYINLENCRAIKDR